MKDKIIKIVENNPKSYVHLIKADNDLYTWVIENTLIESTFKEMIYSAVYQVTNVCENGNLKKLTRWSLGFSGCGPASKCECVRNSISMNVSQSKKNYTNEDKNKINEKRENTMISKYGVRFNTHREDIKHLWKKSKLDDYALSLLNNVNWLNNEYNIKKRSAVDIANELKVYYGTVIEYCIKHGFNIRKNSNYSIGEIEIKQFIESFGFVCEHGNRTILNNKEIDIVVQDKNLGIEYNGLFYHSYNPKYIRVEDQFKHLNKTLLSNEKGISLFHVTDWEWKHRKDIIQSMIKSKLNVCDRLYARKGIVKEISGKESNDFFDANHLHGHVNAQIHLGLFIDNKLVMAISAGRSRFKKSDDYIELYRLASLLNITVVGGGSRLIKRLFELTGGKKIVSYCDRSKSNGNGYTQMGFKLVGETGPGYYWTDGNSVVSRYKSMKANLKSWLSSYDSTKSADWNMFNAGFKRYWDCGNFVFVYE